MADRASKIDTPPRKEAILVALETASTYLAACQATDVPYSTFRLWRDTDEEFAERVAEARLVRQEHLRKMVEERAFTGYLRPVIYKGELQYERYPPGHELAGQVKLDDDLEPIPLMERVMSDQVFLRHAEANLPEYKTGRGGAGAAVSVEAPGMGKTTVEVHFVDPPDWDDVEWDEETGRAKGVTDHGADRSP